MKISDIINKMNIIDKHFIDWENDVFGYGYGTGEQYTLKVLKVFFDNLDVNNTYNYENLELKIGEIGTWFLLNIFGHADIIEYGTSSRYGWLTEKGEILKEYIDKKSFEELYELITNRDNDYIYCGKDYCNCNNNTKMSKCLNNPLF